jgi:membrane protein DedA with SNARE-associated domain
MLPIFKVSEPVKMVSLPVLIVLLIVAAVLGDATNYAIGRHFGPRVWSWEQSRFFLLYLCVFLVVTQRTKRKRARSPQTFRRLRERNIIVFAGTPRCVRAAAK